MGTLVYIGVYKGNEFFKFCTIYDECYGFEPNPELYSKLKIYSNPRIRIINKCVSDFNGTTKFNVYELDRLSSLYEVNNEWLDIQSRPHYKIKEVIDVQCVTIDDYFKDIDDIDFLLIDAQGSDLKILKGAEKFLKEKRIKKIMLETDEQESVYAYNVEQNYNTFDNVNDYLTSIGYRLMRKKSFGDLIKLADSVWKPI